MQWWEIKPNGTVAQQGRIAPNGEDGVFRAYPSLAVNRLGDALIGYSRFSGEEYAAAAYAFHGHDDAGGSTRTEVIYRPGRDVYHRNISDNPWGDYSNTVVDPNGLDFWTVQKYAERREGTGTPRVSRWGTWWAYVPTPAAPPRVVPDRRAAAVPVRPNGLAKAKAGSTSAQPGASPLASDAAARILEQIGAGIPFRQPFPPAASPDALAAAPRVAAAPGYGPDLRPGAVRIHGPELDRQRSPR